MKKVLLIILVVCLAIIAYSTYMRYHKINSPGYSYSIPDSIDINYHDQAVMNNYFQKAKELESYVRTIWYNHGMDVTHIDEKSPESVKYGKYFTTLSAQVAFLERKLKASYLLKSKGFSNEQIMSMEAQGVSEIGWELAELVKVKYGERSQYVWDLQKKLISKGYDIPLDGYFREETLKAVSDFEKSVGMYSSGSINRKMLMKLYGMN